MLYYTLYIAVITNKVYKYYIISRLYNVLFVISVIKTVMYLVIFTGTIAWTFLKFKFVLLYYRKIYTYIINSTYPIYINNYVLESIKKNIIWYFTIFFYYVKHVLLANFMLRKKTVELAQYCTKPTLYIICIFRVYLSVIIE